MNTIEDTVKLAPLFKGKMWRKQIEHIQKKFSNDNLVAVAFKSDGMQQLYVFDNFVYLNEIVGVFSNNEKTIPISNISSVECQSRGLYSDIIITTSGASIRVENVPVSIAPSVTRIIEDSKITK